MSKTVGMGTIAFGSNVLVFLASDGITDTGPTVPSVPCTGDGETTASKETGDVVDWGGFSATIISDDTVNVKALVGTTEAVTVITYPLGSHTTAMTETGPAHMLEAPRSGAENGLNTYAAAFEWKTAPVVVEAT